uniref:Uncharacterized protein n=1 Tax=Rhizophora mucronata TaxID=61149 RepID=A0A2P2QXE7_RHIMU
MICITVGCIKQHDKLTILKQEIETIKPSVGMVHRNSSK